MNFLASLDKTDIIVMIIFGVVLSVLHITSAIVSPIIAGKKGRHVTGWVFCGLFTGIISIIIVSCLKKNRTKDTANNDIFVPKANDNNKFEEIKKYKE